MTNNVLTIVNWNARSILKKSTELFEFLLNRNVDIAVITETWLKKTHSLYHSDFSCIRLDRQSDADRGGGVAIIIRKGIQFSIVDSIQLKIVEAVGIQIHGPMGIVDIIAAYFPGSNRAAELNKFKQDVRSLTNKTNPFFLIGDLNARNRSWNCGRNNKAGIVLQNLASSGFYIHAPSEPTHYPSNGGRPSTLDIVISNNLIQMSGPKVLQELSSDHLPVLFSINIEHTHHAPTTTYKCYRRTNWHRFQREVNNRIDLTSPRLSSLHSHEDIDNAIEDFTSAIVEAENVSVPVVEHTNTPNRLPESILLLIRLRNRRRRQYIRTRDPFIGMIVTSLNNRIQEECAAHRYRNFGKVIESFDSSDRKFWRITRCLRNNTKYSPPLRAGNVLVASASGKAEILAKSFAETHVNLLPGVPEVTSAVLRTNEELKRDRERNLDYSTYTKPKEIAEVIKRMSTNKAPGHDKVRNIVLKHLPKKGLVMLTKIFNACLTLCYFPRTWRHAFVTAIPKPQKDATVPSNYRPISLLSSTSKVFERVILHRINSFLSSGNYIPYEQFGFQAGHSTNHQLVRLTQSVKNDLSQKRSTGLILLDVEKAFDSVWQQALVHKMHHYAFPVYLTKIIQSFLEERSFQVIVRDQLSQIYSIPFGVPQGSTLSPVLYNIFTSDVPKLDGVCYYFFADDTGFSATDVSPDEITTTLQAASNSLADYQAKWRIKVNPMKTQAIFFTRKRSTRHLPQHEIVVSHHPIPWSNEATYLGLRLDKKLNFGIHVNQAILKCKKTVKSLYSMLNRRSRLDRKLKLLLYKSIVRPTLMYGFPAWQCCAESHRKKLQIQQNRVLKMICDLDPFHPTDDVHRIAEIDPVNTFIEKGMLKFRNHCQMSSNPLISSLE